MMVAIGALSILCVGLLIGLVNTKQSLNNFDPKPEPEVLPHPITEGIKEIEEDPETEWEPKINEVDANGEKDGPPWEKNVRLPRSVIPLHYDLYLHPNLEEGTFEGKQIV